MIEFRWHEGVQQYRTWEIDICPVDGTLRLAYGYNEQNNWVFGWTEWQSIPTGPTSAAEVT